MKKKKKTAIVFGLTSNYVFAVASIIMDIRKYNPNLADEIVIFHDGIKVKDQTLLKSILPTIFIKYDFPIKDTSIFHQGTLNYFSTMVYSKYECFKLLNEYKNVLFLDYDQIIKSDISELFSYCESGIKMLSSESKVKNGLHKPITSYDMEKKSICASAIVLQDNIANYNFLYEWCYKKTAEYAEYLYMPEQAIFDFMLQEFNIKPEMLNTDIYCCHPSDVKNIYRAKIIHAWGQPKFWNGIKNKQWNNNYKKWIKMGGTKMIKQSNSNFIKFFKKIISKIRKIKNNSLTLLKLPKVMKYLKMYSLLYKYFMSPQFKINSWTLDQCKNYGKDFEEVYYNPNFISKFDKLLNNLDNESQKTLKFLFFRMLYMSFLNRDNLYEDEEIMGLNKQIENSKRIKYQDGYYLYGKYKFISKNMTFHNFCNDIGLTLLRDVSEILLKTREKDIIDVGAYIGDSSLILSDYTEKNVYAFEPFDSAYSELEANIKLNETKNIVPVKLGISDEIGIKKLYFAKEGLSISTNAPEKSLSKGACTEEVQINTTTIDKFVKDSNLSVGIIKIDAEGAEQAVLRGAMETIKKERPILLVSIYHNISDFMDIKPWIDNLNLGYKYKITKPEPTTFIEETLLVCY